MKRWIMERLLPVWAKETLLAENRQLRRDIDHLQQKIRQQEHYIRGLHKGLGRINIYTGGNT